MYRISQYDKTIDFKKGDPIVLYSKRFRNIAATIKNVDSVNNILLVLGEDGNIYRVDSEEVKPANELNPHDYDLTQIKSVEQEEEYRPVGKGGNSVRQAEHIVMQAFKKIEAQLKSVKIPVTNIKYIKSNVKTWNNNINAVWNGSIDLIVDFMDMNGQKHEASVSVPIESGKIKEVEFITDSVNRKYAFSQDGIKNFLEHINYMTSEDIKGMDSTWTIPGSEMASANRKRIGITKKAGYDSKVIDLLHKKSIEHTPTRYVDLNLIREDNQYNKYLKWKVTFKLAPMFDKDKDKIIPIEEQHQNEKWFKSQKEAQDFIDFHNTHYSAGWGDSEWAEIKDNVNNEQDINEKLSMSEIKEKIITAQNPLQSIKNIITDENELREFKKLLELRKIVKDEITEQESFNTNRGIDKGQGIKYDRLNRINKNIFDILDQYQNSIYDYFNPIESKKTIDNVLKKIADDGQGTDEKMTEEKDRDDEVEPGKKLETQKKSVPKRPENLYERVDSATPSGTGNREFSDWSDHDPKDVRFVR